MLKDDELIVLVDEAGSPISVAPKLESHHSETPLHLAFSVFIFNEKDEVLVTRRASTKKVWPGVWTGSCCGHPAPGESQEEAIQRRVLYELNLEIKNLACKLPNYRYKTPEFKGVVENEVCPVYYATTNNEPVPLSDEVSEYKWMNWDEFTEDALNSVENVWSWWCKDQVRSLEK